jgi:hypothetical protein
VRFTPHIHYYGNTGNAKRPVKIRAQIQIVKEPINKTAYTEKDKRPNNYPAEAAIPENMLSKQVIKKYVIK